MGNVNPAKDNIEKAFAKAKQDRLDYYRSPFTKLEEAELFRFFRTNYKLLDDNEIERCIGTLGAVNGVPDAVLKLLFQIKERKKGSEETKI